MPLFVYGLWSISTRISVLIWRLSSDMSNIDITLFPSFFYIQPYPTLISPILTSLSSPPSSISNHTPLWYLQYWHHSLPLLLLYPLWYVQYWHHSLPLLLLYPTIPHSDMSNIDITLFPSFFYIHSDMSNIDITLFPSFFYIQPYPLKWFTPIYLIFTPEWSPTIFGHRSKDLCRTSKHNEIHFLRRQWLKTSIFEKHSIMQSVDWMSNHCELSFYSFHLLPTQCSLPPLSFHSIFTPTICSLYFFQVVLLFQLYHRFLKSNITKFMPLIVRTLGLQAPEDAHIKHVNQVSILFLLSFSSLHLSWNDFVEYTFTYKSSMPIYLPFHVVYILIPPLYMDLEVLMCFLLFFFVCYLTENMLLLHTHSSQIFFPVPRFYCSASQNTVFSGLHVERFRRVLETIQRKDSWICDPAFEELSSTRSCYQKRGLSSTLSPSIPLNIHFQLLIATRHILATDFRNGFAKHIESLLKEEILVGTGKTCQETLRPLAYSTLADLVHHVRGELSREILQEVVHVYSRNMHDPALPFRFHFSSWFLSP